VVLDATAGTISLGGEGIRHLPVSDLTAYHTFRVRRGRGRLRLWVDDMPLTQMDMPAPPGPFVLFCDTGTARFSGFALTTIN
jgi:hypothetical protein